MSDDLISRQAVLDEIDKQFDLAKSFKQLIKSMPSVKPEQKTGYWTREEHPDAMPTFTVTWRCSVCGEDQSYGEPPFCPNCGAPMERQA